MPAMTDPHDGLVSFQKAMDRREVKLYPCATDKGLFVHVDHPAPEITRYSYTRLSPEGLSTGISILVMVEPYEGFPCFQVGYAVPEQFRGKGLATDILTASIKEIRNGLTRNNVRVPIFIEAMIDKTNVASVRVAEKVLGPSLAEEVDKYTGTPAYHFMLKVHP